VTTRFYAGLQLQREQGLTRPARLVTVSEREVLLTITEGKFHQVKRMFAAVGNRVVSHLFQAVIANAVKRSRASISEG